jgi:chemotaxis-related protein WspD
MRKKTHPLELEEHLQKKIQGVSQLLDRDLPQGYEEQMQEQLLRETSGGKEVKRESLLVFLKNEEYFSVCVKDVDKIISQVVPHRFPHNKEPGVLGVINVSGAISLCISLEKILQLTPVNKQLQTRSTSRFSRMIVMNREGFIIAFEVDHVFGLTWGAEQDILPLPDSMQKKSCKMAKGFLEWKRKQVLLLETSYLFETVQKWVM